MNALRAHRRGGPEVLVHEPPPAPTSTTARCSSRCTPQRSPSPNWAGTRPGPDGQDRTPVIPSHEFSGVVTETGAGVTGLQAGDRVCGLVPFDRDGAAADFVSVPADYVARTPEALPHAAAAALPLAAMTAWQALVDQAAVTSGEEVLVHGGAGGVGAFAVQLATLLGARVTATCRGDTEFVRDLGAARAIDVDSEDFSADRGRYDVVIDTVGGATLDRSFPVLRRGGRLVTLQAPPPAELAQEHGVRASFFIVGPDPQELGHLVELAAEGRLRVTVAASFPLSEGRAAYRSARSRRGRTRGSSGPRPPCRGRRPVRRRWARR